MNTTLLILRKEFRQIFRNRMMLPIILVIPVVQLIVLAYAATFEIKNINISVVDNDLSATSRQLVAKFESAPFFTIVEYAQSVADAERSMKNNETDLIFNIPAHFERTLVREGNVKLQITANAINSTVAGIASAYATNIIAAYNRELVMKWAAKTNTAVAQSKQINITEAFRYNPELDYHIYMVPGILVILVTLIGMLLSGLNLVREKEIGTIEQINVTPIRKYQFIIGKLLPFYIIALFELSFGLLVGKLLFGVPMLGSLFDLFCMVSLYLLAILGIGLFVSTMVDTQQQALFIDYFFLMIFILMGGVFTATESMPGWAQELNRINPISYFVRAIRMILLKGSTLADLLPEIYSLATYGLVLIALSVWRYRKTS